MVNPKENPLHDEPDAVHVSEDGGRRRVLRTLGKASLVLSAPFWLSRSWSAVAQQAGLPLPIIDALNLVLRLKRTEVAFYDQALAREGLLGDEVRPIISLISSQEQKNVTFLEGVLLDNAAEAPAAFDFTVGGEYSPFSSFEDFVSLAQGLEDIGVRALKGQLGIENQMGNFTNTSQRIIDGMLQMHSLEARHAARIRRLRGKEAWIEDLEEEALLSSVYTGEDNTVQTEVDLSGALNQSSEIISESFDEPLSEGKVRTFIEQFVSGE